MNQPDPSHSRLPLLQSLRNSHPKLQPDTLPRRALHIPLIKRLGHLLNTVPQPLIILRLQIRNRLLRLRPLPNPLNHLLNIHNLHQQLLIKRLRARPILRRKINPMIRPEQVLRAEQRVRKRAVCLVDSRREVLGGFLGRPRRVLVRVQGVLVGEELAS